MKCVNFPPSPSGAEARAKVEITRDAIYGQVSSCSFESRDSGIRFYSPGIRAARDIYTTCARARLHYVSSRRADRIAFLLYNRLRCIFFLHGATRVDNFHAEGGRGGGGKGEEEERDSV